MAPQSHRRNYPERPVATARGIAVLGEGPGDAATKTRQPEVAHYHGRPERSHSRCVTIFFQGYSPEKEVRNVEIKSPRQQAFHQSCMYTTCSANRSRSISMKYFIDTHDKNRGSFPAQELTEEQFFEQFAALEEAAKDLACSVMLHT